MAFGRAGTMTSIDRGCTRTRNVRSNRRELAVEVQVADALRLEGHLGHGCIATPAPGASRLRKNAGRRVTRRAND
ncbi:MAG: hypothetical protein U0P30_05780 [Vicinamibacterales bacterium]